MDPIHTPEWLEDANCRGTDLDAWFDPSKKMQAKLAKICGYCPVFSECEVAALAAGEAWGFRAGRWFGPTYDSKGRNLDDLDSRTASVLAEFDMLDQLGYTAELDKLDKLAA